jgi:outer membrane protein TolC
VNAFKRQQRKGLRTQAQAGRAASVLALLLAGGTVYGQAPMPASSTSALPEAPSVVAAQAHAMEHAGGPRYGDISIEQETAGVIPLSLDDAISRGVRLNLQMQLAVETERTVRGEILAVGNNLLPNMKASAYTQTEVLNLAAMGFKPSSLVAFGLPAGSVQEIVHINVTNAQLSLDQLLFNLPDIYLYRAAQKAASVAALNVLNVRGGVIDSVAVQYLAALADQTQIVNEQALIEADEVQLRQATLSHDAGVGTNLDVLRARVQLQTEQQALERAKNTFAKDKIALNRQIGLPAGQEITLTDTVPYAEFTAMPLEQAKALAYTRRKDLLGLEAQLIVDEGARKAARAEHLPQLAFSGYYGVVGETTGLYHGVFNAQAALKIPIFEEARFRGEQEVAAAQELAIQRQIESLKVTIDEQIRASMLDVESSSELVKVAQSNVELAKQELSDTQDRFAAGVSDNLPVVQAQATLAAAESRLVQTQFQYNNAKLQLARNTGVIEIQYKQFLGQ